MSCGADEREVVQRVGMLRLGVSEVVEDPRCTPDHKAKYTIADLVTGWGVAESFVHYCATYGAAQGQSLEGKRGSCRAWGNVGSAAAYYLSKAGARIVGIIDRNGGLMNAEGVTREEVYALFVNKQGNALDQLV